ncbi:hypothetical protein GCM10009613_24680 [Pseudonocardia kongjuensis]|uniref:DUF1059 domain-containing protein n=1 Tax=Pseudonocardia kongjuensis TaxID=102227 RepID=A0ABN1XR41_9PSEU
MLHQVSCECGYEVRDGDEQVLVRRVQQHVRENHPELADQVTPEVIRGWVELVP